MTQNEHIYHFPFCLIAFPSRMNYYGLRHSHFASIANQLCMDKLLQLRGLKFYFGSSIALRVAACSSDLRIQNEKCLQN